MLIRRGAEYCILKHTEAKPTALKMKNGTLVEPYKTFLHDGSPTNFQASGRHLISRSKAQGGELS